MDSMYEVEDKQMKMLLQTRQRNFRNAISNWRKTGAEIEIQIEEARTIEELKSLQPKAEDAIACVNQAFEDLEELSPTSYDRVDSLQEHFCQLSSKIAARLRELSMETRSSRSSGGRSSVSRQTHGSRSWGSLAFQPSVKGSKASGVHSVAVSHAESLQAKLLSLQEENAKKVQITKLTGELKEMKLRRELDSVQIALRNTDHNGDLTPTRHSPEIFLYGKNDSSSEKVERYLKSLDGVRNSSPQNCSRESLPPFENEEVAAIPILNPQAKTFVMPQNNVVDAMEEHIILSRIPPPEPGIFTGDSLKYPAWKTAFEALIESRKIPQKEKLYYLIKYLDKEAKEAVEGFLLMPDDETSYEEAKKLLHRRYGDSFLIANAFREKLNDWPKIPNKDPTNLRKFTDFLNQCLLAMRSIEGLKILNDSRENQKLAGKLPEWMVHRWSRIVVDHREREGVFPKFKVFVDFMEKESSIANDPVFMTTSSVKKITKAQENKPTSRCFVTSSDRPKTEKEKRTVCVYCNKDHIVDRCSAFEKLNKEKKQEFILRKGLCFGCLHFGHRSADCKRRKTCEKCGKRHPTVLHEENFMPRQAETEETKKKKPEGAAVSHCISTGNSSKATLILPVWLSHESDPQREILTYAMLDTQSDSTFILQDAMECLKARGTIVDLRLSTMSTSSELIQSHRLQGLKVRGYDADVKIKLPVTYSRDIMPAAKEHIPTKEMAMQWQHLHRIADKIPPLFDVDIGLLIGYNCTQALAPRNVITSGENDEPFGLQTDLGWGIVGQVTSHLSAMRTRVKEVVTPGDVAKMLELDFNESSTLTDVAYSQEDLKFLKIVGDGIKQDVSGHYEMPLPLRKPMKLTNNREGATQRLRSLKRRFLKDENYKDQYTAFMTEVIESGAAEMVQEELKDDAWYLPHHGVYHPKKPNKIRVVFDGSAKFQGNSLNSQLLQGPDLMNGLLGVLCRFRQEKIAVSCDIEKMFHQFFVAPEHRDYLRFLWWPQGNMDMEPLTYRMKVHVFGAVSSPACANYALKRLAEDYRETYGEKTADFITRNFYVDDGLVSVPTVEEAKDLVQSVSKMCEKGALRLHKFVSNSKEVLESIKKEVRAATLQETDLLKENMTIERTLGVQWCLTSDSLGFRVILQEKPLTKRNILSTVSSVYDPLGFIAPVILKGKQILQAVCKDGVDWDSPLKDSCRMEWEKWCNELQKLDELKISRCFKPQEFEDVQKVQLHHFSDASEKGYAQCSYVRMINKDGKVHCSFVMGKSRVTPLKQVSIPRLELTAAVVSAKVGAVVRKELDYEIEEERFWTDSTVVLGYIASEAKRFHVYVANRVQQIHDYSNPNQWHHVISAENPADEGSRGLLAREMIEGSRWLNGPDFLKQKELPVQTDVPPLDPENPEVKKEETLTACATTLQIDRQSFEVDRLRHLSDWHKMKTALSNCLKLKQQLLQKTGVQLTTQDDDQITQLRNAQNVILKALQQEAFKEELAILSSGNRPPKRSSITSLVPFVDGDGLIGVGGRLSASDLPFELKHPVILPKSHFVTDAIIRHFHKRTGHSGRGITTNEIRANGFWIIGISRSVRHIISSCVTCRRKRGNLNEQVMGDLPEDRMEPAPPFTYCCVDLFGPWIVKNGRKEEKRYGVLFGCMASKAIHIEVAHSLSTDSFINALRRFIAIRGPIRQLRCDHGTNFIGSISEIGTIDEDKLKKVLEKEGCDLVYFKLNVPSGSHAGGIWERQIRTVRGILTDHGLQLNDEALMTFIQEAAAICNGRPITTDTLHDPNSMTPLTPNQLLTMKSKFILPPPGKFQREDLYSRKYWRRVQYLAELFWSRWKKEYLASLQTRAKWKTPRRNMEIDDIVLLKDDQVPRNYWRLARVTEVYPSKDGYVRKVKIAIGDRALEKDGRRKMQLTELERPIQKLVVLLEASACS